MTLKHLLFSMCMLMAIGLLTQCERYGNPMNDILLSDDDSDRPAWAGGDPDENPHTNTNDDSGTTRGGDYGDLYKLLRDVNGVPGLIQIEGNYYVQPVGEDGEPLQLNEEGELVDPTLASEVDFGRLNIVRSPSSVLDQAFEEAMKVLNGTNAVITLDFCGRLTSTYTDDQTLETIVKTIDSPRENMAIYRYLMTNMFETVNVETNRLGFLGEPPYNFDPLMIAASCFAAGSDKTGTVDIDEVVYINGFIDCIGLNPILNEHEYDFNNDKKYYFNFGDCYGDGLYQFQYSRPETYLDRHIQFLVWDNIYYPYDENGVSQGPIFSILDYMEGVIDGQNRFTNMWENEYETHVRGFAMAVDDAVQVLDMVHGDSNIVFVD